MWISKKKLASIVNVAVNGAISREKRNDLYREEYNKVCREIEMLMPTRGHGPWPFSSGDIPEDLDRHYSHIMRDLQEELFRARALNVRDMADTHKILVDADKHLTVLEKEIENQAVKVGPNGRPLRPVRAGDFPELHPEAREALIRTGTMIEENPSEAQASGVLKLGFLTFDENHPLIQLIKGLVEEGHVITQFESGNVPPVIYGRRPEIELKARFRPTVFCGADGCSTTPKRTHFLNLVLDQEWAKSTLTDMTPSEPSGPNLGGDVFDAEAAPQESLPAGDEEEIRFAECTVCHNRNPIAPPRLNEFSLRSDEQCICTECFMKEQKKEAKEDDLP